MRPWSEDRVSDPKWNSDPFHLGAVEYSQIGFNSGKTIGCYCVGFARPGGTSERRTRTLSLGATVRAFNDLAVPGLGGVWFGKQLLLATLGVAIAEIWR